MAIKTILFPTDGSAFSQKAGTFAIDLARQTSAKIIALHVIGVNQTKLLDSSNVEKVKANQAEICFKAFEQEAKSQGVRYKTKMLLSRDIKKAIIEEIDVENPDIIIMGSHGLTGLRKILLGSITEQVLEKSLVPILIVR
jgi:nucleotide-binding universal stress UspA family protein